MKKYKVEGNIDFFSELYKSLDEDDMDNSKDADDNICLISKQSLNEPIIKLNCGHKFNYLPLYNDIVNHKAKFNSMEASQGALKYNQIRCPYCRKKQNELLPYYNIEGVKKIDGVNYIDYSKKQNICNNNNTDNHMIFCEYIYSNPNFNENIEESQENPKTIFCNKYTYFYQVYDANASKYIKCCYEHMKLQKQTNCLKLKEDNKKIKEQAKQKAKEEKLKIKEELKNAVKLAKEEAKQKAKEEKLKMKEEAKQKAKEEKLKIKEELKNAVKLAKEQAKQKPKEEK